VTKFIRPAAVALLLGLPFATPALAESEVPFIDRSGDEIGTATLTDTPNGVLINVLLRGLPPNQWVALHIHETGDCDPKSEFKSAGGHYNPTNAEHGYVNEKGPHAGDLPNQYANIDGSLHAEAIAPMVSLEGKTPIKGKALVIHAGKDDYKSQPAGNAGGRIACAVIK
jgi:Cu-Zn family superoxide dismutase